MATFGAYSLDDRTEKKRGPVKSLRFSETKRELSFIPLIQFPRVESDWLIADPSFSLSPVAPVESALSLRKQNHTF